MAERGIEVDYATLCRWVQRLTPILMKVAGPCRHAEPGHSSMYATYEVVSEFWRYVQRAVDEHRRAIEEPVLKKRGGHLHFTPTSSS